MNERPNLLGESLRHFVLLTGSLIVLLPFLWAIAISLRPPNEIFTQELQILPQSFDAARNYGLALTRMPLGTFLLNGFIVCCGILSCQLLVMIPCAYALAKLHFTGRKTLFALVILGLMVPATALSLPLFLLVNSLKLVDSFGGLILPWSISVFGIFLLRQVFAKVPNDMIEAARLDGLGEFQILFMVMIPIAMPAIGAFCIYSFVHHWNDLLWPSIVTRSINMATPPYGVMLFQSDEAGSDYGALMAGTVIIAAPMIAAFLLFQKRFIDGMSLSAAK